MQNTSLYYHLHGIVIETKEIRYTVVQIYKVNTRFKNMQLCQTLNSYTIYI